MSVSSAHALPVMPPPFADGLGERHLCLEAGTSEWLQVLRLGPALTAAPSCEFALRERTARLAHFLHPGCARVRRVDRLSDGALAVVSDHVDGQRLSEILHATEAQRWPLETAAALCLVRQLLAAVALLHEHARDVSHGLIAPERLIVTPQGHLIVAEHVLGAAVEQLQCSREGLWQQFRAAVPASAGGPRIDHRADVNGIGLTVLSLVLGRGLRTGEFPHGVPGLLMHARERLPLGEERPLPNGLRNWLARTLQLDVRRAFASAPEALAAFEDAVVGEPTQVPDPVALQAWLARVVPGVPVAPSVPSSGPVPAANGRVDMPALGDLIAVDDLGGGGAAQVAVVNSVSDPEEVQEAPGPGVLPPADVTPDRRRTPAWRPGWKSALAAALAVMVAALIGVRFYGSEPPGGTLVVQSSPAGADVFVDGVHRGVTPLRLPVAAGSHILELRGRGVPRVIPIQVPAGGQVSQYLEFADTPRTGMLVVHAQPAGATVIIDGVVKGVAPLTVEGLQPGTREVVLRNDKGSSRHLVNVLAGTASSLVAPVVAPSSEGPVSGWVSVKAPFTLQIYQDARLIGTTETERLMVASGNHVLELVNDALGYRESRAVKVHPGKVTVIAPELPTGRLDLNASPWAEVWVDGRSVGETPLGNLELPIGPYELVFRHPQFAERRHAVSVTTAAPVRVSIAMQ